MNPTPSNTGANTQITGSIGYKPSGATVGIGWVAAPVSGNTASGWYLDPTPFDSSEFTSEFNAFVSQPNGTSPANGRGDLFTAVAHELGGTPWALDTRITLQTIPSFLIW